MRLLQILFFTMTALTCLAQRKSMPTAVQNAKPGEYLSASFANLGDLPDAPSILPSLPPAAAQTKIITCSYAPQKVGGTAELRRYWYRDTPPWLASVPADNPVRKLVPRSLSLCLATLERADSSDAAAVAVAKPVPPRAETKIAAAPPRPSPVQAVSHTDSPLTAASFVATGLVHQKALNSLYLGEFLEVPFNREDNEFVALFEKYLEAYATECASALPPDKVEMMRKDCAQERYPVNRYGGRVGPNYCVSYEEKGTGLWANPALYEAKVDLDSIVKTNALRDALRMMAQGNAASAAANLTNLIQTYETDMNSLLKLNSCTSPAVKRFQENVRLFSLNKQPIRLSAPGGTSLAARPSAPALPSTNQNYEKFVDDLIVEQSKTWIMNRYASGGVTGVTISARDRNGQPSKLVAQYIFNGKYRGSVTIEFEDGLPQCMYFSDMNAVCKTPDRRIVAAFASGKYSN